ncbi:hypothetical protein V2J09_016508 [Rumex salicifolius]
MERQAEKILYLEKAEVKRRADNLKELLISLRDQYANRLGAGSSQKSRNLETSTGNEISSKGRRNGKEKVVCTGKKKAMLEDWDKQLEEGEDLVVGHEVDRYLLDPIEKPKAVVKFKITQWWRDNWSKYPLLQAIARDGLPIQVSTVASESSFSTGKRVVDPYRSSMTPKTVEALIYFQNWSKSDNIMALEYIPSIEEIEFYEKERLEEVSQAAVMGRLGTSNTIAEECGQ